MDIPSMTSAPAWAMAPGDATADLGWRKNPAGVEFFVRQEPSRANFYAAAPHLIGTGADLKLIAPYKAFKDVNGGSYIPYPAQTIGDCFPAGTMVMGETIKPIEDVQVGDKVWTGEGRLTTVVSTRSLTTMRPIMEIKAVGMLPIRCTEDHQFLVYRLPLVAGKRITPRRYAGMVGRSHRADAAAVIERYEGRRPEWVRARDLQETDCLLTPIELDRPDLGGAAYVAGFGRFFLGYFLGNGSAGGGSVELTMPLDSPHKDRLIKEAEEALGFSPKVECYEGRAAERIRIHSKALVRAFREAFYAGGEKTFPSWAIGDTSFLAGLYAADGHGADPSCCPTKAIDSTSRSIIYGAVASLIRMGYEPTVNLCSRSEGTYANAKPLYRINWRDDRIKQNLWRDDRFVCRPIRSIDQPFEGPTVVYDIGVADEHHSFLANGVAVHNCTSQGTGHGLDLLEAIAIVLRRKPQQFRQVCTEALYGAGRERANMLGSGDGCYGAAMADAAKSIGVASRDDLGPYDGQRAKQWGRTGIPDSVRTLCQGHKLNAYAKVETWDQYVDAQANLKPVAVCSDRGFALTRDKDGFCAPSGTWQHCMLHCGVRQDDRPGGLIFQSWGPDSPTGPLVYDQPPNSFWADRATVEKMLAEGDSWALDDLQGWPGQGLPGRWAWSDFASPFDDGAAAA